MNVKIILISFVIFAIVISVYFDGDMDEKQLFSNIESQAKEKRVDDIEILYEKHGDDVKTHVLIKNDKYPDKMIIIETYDASKKFKIALLSSGTKIINDENHTTLLGKIDDSTFTLKVPNGLIEKEQEDVVLEVTDLELNQVRRTPFVFLNELKNRSLHHTLIISSKNISNYEYTTEKANRLPGSNKLY